VDSDSGIGEGAITWCEDDDWPARTMDQSSSSHRHVAVRLTLAPGSVFVGAGRMMVAGGGREKEAGGETGRRWESHLSRKLTHKRSELGHSPTWPFLRQESRGPV
jgi:hypothetical protein